MTKKPAVVLGTYDQIGLAGGEFDVAIHNIGGREDLSDAAAKRAADAYRQIIATQPGLKHCEVLVSGWDEDPREIWEIPEAADYFRRWAAYSYLTTLDALEKGKIGDLTVKILAKCGCLTDVNPDDIDIEVISWDDYNKSRS